MEVEEYRILQETKKKQWDKESADQVAERAAEYAEMLAGHAATLKKREDDEKARQLKEEQEETRRQQEIEARRKKDEDFAKVCEEYKQRKSVEDLSNNSQNIRDYIPCNSYKHIYRGYVYYFNVAPGKSVNPPMMTGPYICVTHYDSESYYSTFDRLHGERDLSQSSSGQVKRHGNKNDFPIYVLKHKEIQDKSKNFEEHSVSRYGEDTRGFANMISGKGIVNQRVSDIQHETWH